MTSNHKVPEGLLARLRKELFAWGLCGTQVERVLTFLIWTPAESWWIMQAIAQERKLTWAAPTLFNALIDRKKGEFWLMPYADRVNGADWVEVPEDSTGAEDPTRRAFRMRLGRLQRLPLDQEGVGKREAILTVLSEAPPVQESVSSVSLLRDLDSMALADLKEALQTVMTCNRAFSDACKAKADRETRETFERAATAAEEEVAARLKGVGTIRLMSGAEVTFRTTGHWPLLQAEMAEILPF
jgi:hypothetical protein